jgi:hypothetical protein
MSSFFSVDLLDVVFEYFSFHRIEQYLILVSLAGPLRPTLQSTLRGRHFEEVVYLTPKEGNINNGAVN